MTYDIMVVDDNPEIRETVQDQLNTMDPSWTVRCAASGTDCLHMLRSKKADLIIMDIMMPEMDGWDAVAAIRRDETLREIPVVFLSAKTDDFSKGLGAAIAHDYVEKPYRMVDLYRRIKKALDA